MSAYIVEDSLINSVVATIAMYRGYGEYPLRDTVAKEQGFDLSKRNGQQDLAEAMFRLNCKAVEERYGEGTASDFRELNFRFRAVAPTISLIQAYKSLGCWLYQCSEGDIPDQSLLYATMDKVHGELAHAIVRSLPAYDKAEW